MDRRKKSERKRCAEDEMRLTTMESELRLNGPEEQVQHVWVRVAHSLRKFEQDHNLRNLHGTELCDVYTRIFNLCVKSDIDQEYEKLFFGKYVEWLEEYVQRMLVEVEANQDDATAVLGSLWSSFKRAIGFACKVFRYLERFYVKVQDMGGLNAVARDRIRAMFEQNPQFTTCVLHSLHAEVSRGPQSPEHLDAIRQTLDLLADYYNSALKQFLLELDNLDDDGVAALLHTIEQSAPQLPPAEPLEP